MAHVDTAAAIRDRAYEIWEHQGRPSGREHEHWAEARRQIEADMERENRRVVSIAVVTEPAPVPLSPDAIDAVRLRRALYEPEAFSFELFGSECPEIACPELVAGYPLETEQRTAA